MRHTIILSLLLLCSTLYGQSPREVTNIDNGWRFAYGDASDMYKDYTHGTEYFTYLTKVQSTDHNRGPAWNKFDDSQWQTVNLPHDWVVDLPYSGEASHSHGYKMVGAKYPENSIGWYRKHFHIDAEDKGERIYVQFDGIFRDAQVFCNGFYLGHEVSGYATQIYDITEYLDYGRDNLLTVRADASTEEGWFYEGAGIYRHVWLIKTSQVHIPQFGAFITSEIRPGDTGYDASANITLTVRNDGLNSASFHAITRVLDASGAEVARTEKTSATLESKEEKEISLFCQQIKGINLWDLENPYLYTFCTDLYSDDSKLIDSYSSTFGFRTAEFDPQRGFLLNGKEVKLKGTNLHQDHAGVGSAIPDELWAYRIKCLKEIGSNAIRTSHNPVSPAMLDLCDRMGMLVMEENRLIGINDEHIDLLRRMIVRDRNHPSIIVWSIGNEEWAVEGSEKGKMIAESMTSYVHRFDPTRLTSYGCSGGRVLLYGVDVKGYNYIVQNDVEGFHRDYPEWCAVGTEETTGCGTRGIYFTDPAKGWMLSFNRAGVAADPRSDNKSLYYNVIERGWKFYAERPWLGGLFYWTGIDYRGEPNPMKFPATGSQFGILDYCGFPKDEAFYLKSWWTSEPVLHISPHWNAMGKQKGDSVKVFIYSNADEVQLFVNKKSLGRKAMPANGHLEWDVVYTPGSISARGYREGKKISETVIATTGKAVSVVTSYSYPDHLLPEGYESPDGESVIIADMALVDDKGRIVPDAMDKFTVTVDGAATILGWGNGDPGFKEIERPLNDAQQHMMIIQAFSGRAQVLLRTSGLEDPENGFTLHTQL